MQCDFRQALTALGLGQTMFGLRDAREACLILVPSRLVEIGEPFFAPRLTTQKRYDCSAAFPCTGGTVHKFNIGQTVFLELYILNGL